MRRSPREGRGSRHPMNSDEAPRGHPRGQSLWQRSYSSFTHINQTQRRDDRIDDRQLCGPRGGPLGHGRAGSMGGGKEAPRPGSGPGRSLPLPTRRPQGPTAGRPAPRPTRLPRPLRQCHCPAARRRGPGRDGHHHGSGRLREGRPALPDARRPGVAAGPGHTRRADDRCLAERTGPPRPSHPPAGRCCRPRRYGRCWRSWRRCSWA